jgi:uncharacterized membrane protein required for colicin V production
MNWLDYTLVAIILGSVLLGFSIGLLEAIFLSLGALFGWILASLIADDIGGMLSYAPMLDTWITSISFVVIIAITVVIMRYVSKLVRPVLSIVTVGLSVIADKIGGVLLGLVTGLAITCAIIIVMARFTYDFETGQGNLSKEMKDKIPQVEEVREGLEDNLINSALAPNFIEFIDLLPSDALGLIPSDLKASLSNLKKSMMKTQSQ